MQKAAPSLGRILVMVGFALSCFGLLLFLWLAFGGPIPLKPKGYRFTVSFQEAGQLAQEADVRISGVSVGKVKAIEPDPSTGLADATIELQAEYAPIGRDTRAILRQKTLLGETYVELTPGRGGARPLADGGRLARAQVSPTVELDEIFRAFDAPTRDAFRQWMQELALASRGRGGDINAALGNLPGFEQDTTTLLKVLNAQRPALRAVVRDTGQVLEALSARDAELRRLIVNADRVFAITAARADALRQTFVALPTFEREARQTVTRLARFARATDPLVTQLRPAARRLGPTLRDVAALSPDLRALFGDLDPLIDASAQGLPSLERFLDQLRPVLGEVDAPLRQLNPTLDFVGGYRRELTAFFANVVASTQAGTLDRNGNTLHYLRTTNPLNPENLAAYPRRIGSNRPNPYQLPDAFDALRRGLPLYETRHCGRGDPTLATQPLSALPPALAPTATGTLLPQLPGLPAILPLPAAAATLDPTTLVPPLLAERIVQIGFAGRNGGPVPAPPCRQQPPFAVQGETTRFPRVKPATGTTAGPPGAARPRPPGG